MSKSQLTPEEEERLAIEEEERALAEWQAAMAARDQPVVPARQRSDRGTTIADQARLDEEQARRELMEAAEAASQPPRLSAGIVVSAEAVDPNKLIEAGVPVVGGSVVEADPPSRPAGGIPALGNMLSQHAQ